MILFRNCGVNNIYMMRKSDKRENIQLQKEEIKCNCFTYHYPERDYFLSKNQKHQRLRLTNNQHGQKSTDSMRVPKNKKSLKKTKQHTILSPQAKKEIDVYQQYYSPPKISARDNQKTNQWRQVRQMDYKVSKPKVIFKRINEYVSFPDKKAIDIDIRSNYWQEKELNIQEIKSGPMFYSPQHQNYSSQQLKTKIYFSINNSQPVIPFSGEISNTNIQLFGIIKDENKDQSQTVQKIQTQTNIQVNNDQINPKIGRVVKSRNRQDEIDHQKQTNHQELNIKEISNSFVNKNHLLVPNTKLSRIKNQLGKSKINLKQIKERKPTLKKISDVQQIRSMVDSQEQSDNDKESIVLGRLRQYGSVSGSSQSILPTTIQSKMGYQSRLGYQSTTVGGKSHLRTYESVFR